MSDWWFWGILIIAAVVTMVMTITILVTSHAHALGTHGFVPAIGRPVNGRVVQQDGTSYILQQDGVSTICLQIGC